MYFRMLKKDLKEKAVLNIVLCIFMIIAATLIVISAGFIYTFIAGIDDTYEKCNTSDIIFTVDKSVSDEEGQRQVIGDILGEYPEISEISISERMILSTSRLEFVGIDRREVTNLYDNIFMVSPVSNEHNIPYDRSNRRFTLSDGCVAIPEVMAHNAGTSVGDRIRLTTDMGNIYEFTVSHIFKDPSTSMINKILFSDGDLERLGDEFAGRTDLYEINLETPFPNVGALQKWGWSLNDTLLALHEDGVISGSVDNVTTGKCNMFTDEAMISLIVSIFMMIMGVSLIILIFMSISFSLQATIKREEREIGTMKAIGVDSLSYRSLFIVKYIAFACLGGIVGLIAGIPLEKYIVGMFVVNTLSPDIRVILLLGVIGSVTFILLMTAFAFISLRKMNRVSVMDTIHGENRGERFSKIPGLQLNKSRKIPVPVFLALQDIIRKIRRYIFLIVSYTIGMLILFLVFQLKDSVVSDEYRKTYWQIADRNVRIRPDDSLREKLVELKGGYRNVFEYYEEYYNDHGIPLDIQIIDEQTGYMVNGDERTGCAICFGDYDISRLVIVDGGTIPALPNEVAVSHFLQNTAGVEIGDIVTLEYEVYLDDGIETETARKDFLVTAYVETLGNANTPAFFMGEPEDSMVMEDFDLFNEAIYVPDDEYDDYIERMRAVNEDIAIWDYDQVMDYDLGNTFGRLLNMLAVVTGLIMILTLFSMTFLYEQIFIEEETSDIAMLKSMGSDKRSIRMWHYFRLLTLVVISTIISVILAYTLNRTVFDHIGRAALGVGRFIIVAPSAMTLIVLPASVVLIITFVMIASFKMMDQIRIWRIRNE
ncbi:MAG: FtsX-like permease family protein [Lachnospiraceae bacterium]|nr:FtsX-like permease family protein [Lachnospiraceae bacterium]